MAETEKLEAELAKPDRCKYPTYGYACGKPVEHGRYLCDDHAAAKCRSCGQQATHGCDYCGQFVCGSPLCDECTSGTDQSKPSGNWGFINHIHVSKPEFADKHTIRRLETENATLRAANKALVDETLWAIPTAEQIASKARAMRGKTGLRTFARQVGVSPATLCRIESGKEPDMKTFRALAAAIRAMKGETHD